ncbi:MAG: beta-galactosidase [Ruminococcaceae bacterium]|nr:beta-galactosidase [Oscillospiraceae bacterium]
MEEKLFIYGADYNAEQWRDNPEILEQDIALMKQGGFNAVSIGIFAWGVLEPQEGVYDFSFFDQLIDRLYRENIKIILATPSASVPIWMGTKYPEILRVNENRIRVLPGRRVEHCLSSKILQKKVQKISKKLSERYADKVYLWHISNEYYGACHCEKCQKEFREWLRKKYQDDIMLLNRSWYNDFWSGQYSDWDEIESPAPHGRFSSGALQIEWSRFVTHQTVLYMKNEINAVDKNIPVTTNFHGVLNDLDYWELSKYVDITAWDMYPHWHLRDDYKTGCETAFVYDLCRSFKKQPFLLMESAPSCPNHTEIPNKLKQPGFNILSSLHAVAHGADSVQYFQWRKSKGGYEKLHGAVVDHYGKADTRVFRECEELGRILGDIKEIAGTKTKSDVAIVYSFENRRLLEYAAGYSVQDLKYKETCISHYEYFYQRGISVDIVSPESDFSGYRLVIAPMLYLTESEFIEKSRVYVASGGHLVMTYISGIVNGLDCCWLGGFPAGGLMELFGLRAEETDCILPEEEISVVYGDKTFPAKDFCELLHPESCQIVATVSGGMYDGLPAVTKNQFGDGKAYYLGVRSDEEMLTYFYDDICRDAQLCGALTLPQGVAAAKRGVYLFLQNFTKEERVVCLPEDYYSLKKENISGTVKIEGYQTLILKREEK